MKKIISLFQRNYDGDRLVRNEVVPGADWVLEGEGIPTRKYDGTCCMVRGGELYKRYELKQGKTAPMSFEPATDVDEVTGKQQGWVPVGDGPEDRWHREAFANATRSHGIADGTFEAVGPHFQGNPDGFPYDTLVRHGLDILPLAPRTFDGLREYLDGSIEGIVWHHPDGRMVKIKAKDFGKKRIPAAVGVCQ